MAQIAVKHLTFCYEGSFDNVLEDVTFQIDTDWKLGFIGRNGRGKTTFLRLLMREFPFHGRITAPTGFAYFPFRVQNPDGLAADVAGTMGTGAPIWAIQREMADLMLDDEVLSRPYATLSGGEKTKLQLAALFAMEDSFLLIDEPTNHLDYHGRALVSRYLNRKKGFILVSHDRDFMDGCVDHILALNRKTIAVCRGNFTTWWENKQNQDNLERAENEKLKREIGRLKVAAEQTERWSDAVETTKIGSGAADRGHIGHMAAKMMKRSKSTLRRVERSIDEKEKLLKDIETVEDLHISALRHHSDRLVTARDLCVQYDGQTVCGPVSFDIRQGERVALIGPNGCGKSSIIKRIMGMDVQGSGLLRLASGLTISYVPQDTSGLSGDLRTYIQAHRLDETLFKTILRKLDFSRIQFEKPIESYSSGQKKKVLIAKSLCERAHLYIWDEPLNFIDVFSRIQLEQILRGCAPTLLIVEHDRRFLEGVCDQTVAL